MYVFKHEEPVKPPVILSKPRKTPRFMPPAIPSNKSPGEVYARQMGVELLKFTQPVPVEPVVHPAHHVNTPESVLTRQKRKGRKKIG